MNRSDYPTVDGEAGDDTPRRRSWWRLTAAIAALALAASLLLPVGRHEWALSLIRQPTRYTALAFKYAWLLPANATIDARIPVFFTVANQEGSTQRYRYVVREIDPLGNSRTLGGADITVAAGATGTVDTSVRPTCSLSPCQIQVSLPGHQETIDFDVVLTASTRKHRRGNRRHKHGHDRGRT